MIEAAESRAQAYRDIGYRLWRLSLDRGNAMSFETRSRLATIADDLEHLAGQVERERVAA